MTDKKRNVYHLDEINENRFYKLPKHLFLNTYYNDLSSNAKILYSVLVDRMELSRVNNWINENDEIYLIFTRKNISKLLNISGPTTTKIFKELREKNLIYEEPRGFDNPNKIFIGKIDYSQGEIIDTQGRLRNLTTRLKNFASEVKKFNPSETELSDTDLISETDKKEKMVRNQGSPLHSYSFSSDKTQNLLNSHNLCQEIYGNVRYYFNRYRQEVGEEHPKLKLQQWNKVFKNITGEDYDLLDERFKLVVDQHFKVNYGQEIDYNILHFVSGDIIKNRVYEVAY